MRRRRRAIALGSAAAAAIACLGVGPLVTTSEAAAPGIRVDGTSFVEGNGTPLVLRGANHAHTWYPGETDSFAQIRAAGANAVRVVLSNGDQWTRNSSADITAVINLCKANSLICVLEVHDSTGWGDTAYAPRATDMSRAVDYWIANKAVLVGQESYVIINIANEPVGNDQASQWTAQTTTALQRMRAAGFQHALVVDAPNWGQDYSLTMQSNAQTVLAADPQADTMLSVHMYQVYGTATAVNQYLDYYRTRGLPVMVGEFGWAHSTGASENVAEEAIIAYAKQYGTSWLAWSWCGNGGGVEYLDLIAGGCSGTTLTAWGTTIKNALTGTPTASIYTATTPSPTPTTSTPTPTPSTTPTPTPTPTPTTTTSGTNLSLSGGADGTSKASGTSYSNVRDGNVTTYWAPNATLGSVSVKWTTAQTVRRVVVRTASGGGTITAWQIRNADTGAVLASGTGVPGTVTFPATSTRKVTLQITGATAAPRIAELETYTN